MLAPRSRFDQKTLSCREREDLYASSRSKLVEPSLLLFIAHETIIVEQHDSAGGHLRPKVFRSSDLRLHTVHVYGQVRDPLDVDGVQRLRNRATDNLDPFVLGEVMAYKFE